MGAPHSKPAHLSAWKYAILDSKLSPITKLVLLALSCRMNKEGGSCFPSIERIMKDTGLSKQAVHTHIKKASVLDWVIKTKTNNGKGWANNNYQASLPQKVVNKVDHPSKPDTRGRTPHTPYVVNERTPEVVNEVDTNTTYISTNNSSKNSNDSFEEKTCKECKDYSPLLCLPLGTKIDTTFCIKYYEKQNPKKLSQEQNTYQKIVHKVIKKGLIRQ